MTLRLAPLTTAEARAIGEWRYDPPYDFYNWTSDPEDLAELLDPASWPGRYYAAFDATGVLVGFFQFARSGDTVEVGLGLHPSLTGRGRGGAFVRAGLAFARQQFAPQRFTLRVATFNHRAIQVYERVGFRAGRTFPHATNGGVHEFLAMSRPA